MAVKALYALQNGFLGFERKRPLLRRALSERVRSRSRATSSAPPTPPSSSTPASPRAVPGLSARIRSRGFADETSWCIGWTRSRSEPKDVDMWCCPLHFDHAGGATSSRPRSWWSSRTIRPTGIIRRPSSPRSTTEELDSPAIAGDCSTATWSSCRRHRAAKRRAHAGAPVAPGQLPESRPVVLAGDCCYWQRSIDERSRRAWFWDPTRAMHSFQAAQDHRPAHGRADLPQPRSRVLGNRRRRPRRVSVTSTRGRLLRRPGASAAGRRSRGDSSWESSTASRSWNSRECRRPSCPACSSPTWAPTCSRSTRRPRSARTRRGGGAPPSSTSTATSARWR